MTQRTGTQRTGVRAKDVRSVKAEKTKTPGRPALGNTAVAWSEGALSDELTSLFDRLDAMSERQRSRLDELLAKLGRSQLASA